MSTECVRVMVRCRPMNQKQIDRGCHSVINIDNVTNQVRVIKNDPKIPLKSFTFDNVFGPDALQSVIYQQTAFGLVDNVIQGYNGTIFAYGQTGCGKTHTMMGLTDNQSSRGIIPRTFHQIITLTGSQKQKNHLVQCSYIQIYNEDIHDLLGKDVKMKMQLKQSPDKGVFVKDLTMNLAKTEGQMQKIMDNGFKNRAVRETAMNKQSSRSHSIFTIHIESSHIDELGQEKFRAGKLNLVDLAGSQRQSKTHATGDGMKQAAKINLSLSALGNVISALVDGKAHHIPYRDSKLTRLLQDSLGGNTKTIMIAAVSPADYNYEETISTLRYANRAKNIQNKPTINEDPKDALLRQYAEEIQNLKMMLQGKLPMQAQMKISNQTVVLDNPNNGGNIQLQNELRNRDNMIRSEQQQKEILKHQLQNLQKIIGSDENNIDKKQVQKMKKMKDQLKIQKKRQEQWKQEKKKKQEQLLTIEKSYKTLNEEIQSLKIRFKQIKQKYIENLAEIQDIQKQHQQQKQQLLDTIRMQQSQIGKFQGITRMLLNSDQIEQIISQSQYNDENKQWIIVPFYYREKSVNFPKLNSYQTKQLIQNEKNKKQIIFKQQNSYIKFNQVSSIIKNKDSYKMSEVVKGARQFNDKKKQYQRDSSINNNTLKSSLEINGKSKNNNISKNQLSPLKCQSEQYFKVDDQQQTNTNGNSLQKLKLNPISTKKDILKQYEQFRNNNYSPT